MIRTAIVEMKRSKRGGTIVQCLKLMIEEVG